MYCVKCDINMVTLKDNLEKGRSLRDLQSLKGKRHNERDVEREVDK